MKNEIFPLRPQSQVISGDSTSITTYKTQTLSLLNGKKCIKLSNCPLPDILLYDFFSASPHYIRARIVWLGLLNVIIAIS